MRNSPPHGWKAILAIACAPALLAAVAVTAVQTSNNAAVAADIPVTIMGAGDIAESGSSTQANATATGDLIRAANPNYVVTVGDNAYPDGTATDYSTKYEPTWGSFKAKTKPAPGNHEYHTGNPAGYLSYFGQANVTTNNDPNQVWYAWDIGNGWRGYSLNTEISTAAGSAQETWLKADLAAHPGMHYVAYTHHPRYVSGTIHGAETSVCPLWNALQAAGGDLMLAGHEHHYERFAKMDCTGGASSTGMREFLIGSGGNQLYSLGALTAGSEAQNDTDFGVLKLVLHDNSYDWQFIASGRCWNGSTSVDCAASKGVVKDSGTQATNRTSTPVPTTTTTATASPSPTPTTTTTTTSPPPPPGVLPPRYISNEEGQYATTSGLGYTVHDTGMSAATINALPGTDKALIWTGTGKCPSTTLSAAFTSFVSAQAANPKIFGYYLADEPDNQSAACVAGIKAYADYIRATAPNHKSYVLLTDYPGSYAAFKPSASGLDIIGLDPYPCRLDTGTCNLDDINAQVTAAVAAGVPASVIAPTFQAFGDPVWKAPTATQLQQILDRWDAVLPRATRPLEHTYSWGCQAGARTDCVLNRADWQPVLQAYNSAPAPSPAPTTPVPTTTTPTTTTPVPTTPVPTTTTPTTTTPAPSPTPTTTTPPAPSPTPTAEPVPTIDRRIATTLGDVEQCCAAGDIYENSTDLEMVYDGATYQIVGMRFPSLPIPKGATILEAWVEFTAKDSTSTAASLTVQTELADNAAPFTTAKNNVGGRTYSPFVNWTPTAWAAGSKYKTPSLTSVVQSVVNRPGWALNNAIVVKVGGYTGSVRNAWSYDGSSSQAPVLHIFWS